MGKLKLRYHDFEASIRICSRKEGGQATLSHNGIIWDFVYADEDWFKDGRFVIGPDFYETDGVPMNTDLPLPAGKELIARMVIFNDELRVGVHRHRIAPGVRFYYYDGVQRVAEGAVTKITGLYEPRTVQ